MTSSGIWGPTMLARWPERIVTEIVAPCSARRRHSGRRCGSGTRSALTTWYLAEGPYAVTDTAGLAERHAVDLEDLARSAALWTRPVPPS